MEGMGDDMAGTCQDLSVGNLCRSGLRGSTRPTSRTHSCWIMRSPAWLQAYHQPSALSSPGQISRSVLVQLLLPPCSPELQHADEASPDSLVSHNESPACHASSSILPCLNLHEPHFFLLTSNSLCPTNTLVCATHQYLFQLGMQKHSFLIACCQAMSAQGWHFCVSCPAFCKAAQQPMFNGIPPCGAPWKQSSATDVRTNTNLCLVRPEQRSVGVVGMQLDGLHACLEKLWLLLSIKTAKAGLPIG